MKKTAIILYHNVAAGPGTLSEVLVDRYFKQEIIPALSEDISNIDPEFDGLLMILGGAMSVYEADKYDFISQEINLVKKRVEAGLPYLGICFGAQIMAAALGGEVYKGKNGYESGWYDLDLSEDGENHPIKHLGRERTRILEWHGDTFNLPKGAKLLASTENYENQVFSYGPKALAIQAHPEFTRDGIEMRIRERLTQERVAEKDLAKEKERMLKETAKYIETMKKQTKLFFHEWLDSIGF